MSTTLLTGSEAAAYGAKLAKIEVIAYYPITPAFPAMERVSKFIQDGELKANFVRVESDHSALAATLGASLAGARAFTVTNSQGLLYMTEVCYHTAGLRQPVVMACANRALSAPHSRFPEQGDAVSQGANGWIQLFCENNQEVLDNTIQAFKIAETVKLPVLVNYEGYVQSHTLEEVVIPDQEKVNAFLPLVRFKTLDVENPQGVNTVTSPDFYMDYKFRQNEVMNEAVKVIGEVAETYGQEFGRNWSGLIETYKMDGAEHALVCMGSMVSEARLAVDELRSQGKKVGLVKVRAWRPFPVEALRASLKKVNKVTVFDKNIVYGMGGALGTEVRGALYGQASLNVNSYIVGLGGRKFGLNEIKQVIELSEKTVKQDVISEWFGL